MCPLECTFLLLIFYLYWIDLFNSCFRFTLRYLQIMFGVPLDRTILFFGVKSRLNSRLFISQDLHRLVHRYHLFRFLLVFFFDRSVCSSGCFLSCCCLYSITEELICQYNFIEIAKLFKICSNSLKYSDNLCGKGKFFLFFGVFFRIVSFLRQMWAFSRLKKRCEFLWFLTDYASQWQLRCLFCVSPEGRSYGLSWLRQDRWKAHPEQVL